MVTDEGTSGVTLDDLGITLCLRKVMIDYARNHLPHLLLRKSRRLRKKALRDLGRRMTLGQKGIAFQLAVMEKADEMTKEIP